MHHHLGLTVPSAVNAATASGYPSGLDDLGKALLAMAAPGLDSRIVILAPGALELTCALLRQGHRSVTLIRLSDHPRTGEADVAIMPYVVSVEFLERALPCVRRILLPRGVLALALTSDLPHGAVRHARRQLLLHGFAAAHTRTLDGETVLRAELPLCMQTRRA